MMNEKGQIQALSPAILALVFAAIVLVMGLVILQGVVDTRDATQTATVANETFPAFTDGVATQTLGNAAACGFGTIDTSSFVLFNATGDIEEALTTDYTITSAGVVTNTSATYSIYTGLVSYTYTWGGDVCQPGEDTVAGLGTFADFWEIIVLAVVIMIVIGLLLVVFGGNRRR